MASDARSLADVCSLIVDCPHSTPTWTDSGYVVLRNQNIRNGRLDLSDPSFTDREHFDGRNRRATPQAGDIVLTREAPMGEACMIPDGLQCCIGQRQVLLRPDAKLVSPRFLLYALQSTSVKDQIGWNEGTGSTVSNIRIPVLKAIKVPTPPRDTQDDVAETLGALDDRIDNLRATNATLEAIAQALFKSWFVDFDPVHAKAEGRAPEGMDAATAALFPSEFEDSEIGPVPKGWRVASVGSVMHIKGGKQLAKEDFSENGPNPVFGGAGEMGRSDKSNAEGLVITVGRVGAYCGRFFWYMGKAWVNNNASRVKALGAIGLWAYWCLRHLDIDSIKKGAAQPFVSNSDIAKLLIVTPGERLVGEFNSICTEVHDRISLGLRHAATLTGLRDTLLPRLTSGKLRLPEPTEAADTARA